MDLFIMRPGKTARDKRTGAYARHFVNQETRRKWNQEYMTNAKSGGLKIIPYPKIGL